MIKNLFKVLPILLIAFVLFTSDAKAGAPVNLNGYAWSDNIGWVSFNSDNSGAGSGANYAVTLATSTGNPNLGTFGGYAWSSNIGWVSFNPSINSTCPLQTEDNGDCTPRVNMKTGQVQGWIRALAGCTGDATTWDGTKCLVTGAGKDNGVSSSSIITSTTTLVTVVSSYPSNSGWKTKYSGIGGSLVVSSDSDKQLLASYPYLYTSTDGGTSWVRRISVEGSMGWEGIAMDSTGTKLFAIEGTLSVPTTNGYIFTSIDSGANWVKQTNAGAKSWYAIAASSDGTKLVATTLPGQIYTSTDNGVNWTQRTSLSNKDFWAVTSSSNGKYLAAAATNNSGYVPDYIYTSNDYGVTWNANTNAGLAVWSGITSTADGKRIAAFETGLTTGLGGNIYVSTDYGVSWTRRDSAGQRPWFNISYSPDGKLLTASDYMFCSDCSDTPGYVYLSYDDGVTWVAQKNLGVGKDQWLATSASSDSLKLFASNGSNTYVSVGATSTMSVIKQISTPVSGTGWDGWIHLSGDKHVSPTLNGTGGVTYASTTGVLNGYAWGSDVVGWLNFNSTTTDLIIGKPPIINPTQLIGVCATNQLPGAVVWSIQNISGGTGPYSYRWNGGASTTNSYVSAGPTGSNPTAPSVIVASTDGQVISPTCSPGTVQPPCTTYCGQNIGGKMWVDNDINEKLVTTKITTGGKAKINWRRPVGYADCSPYSIGTPVLPGWSGIASFDALNSHNYTTDPINNNGIYNIGMICTDGTNTVPLNPVKIIVSSSVIKEI